MTAPHSLDMVGHSVDSVHLNRGIRYSVLPALTIDGYMTVRVVEGSIDGAEFYDFVVNDVASISFSVSEFPLIESTVVAQYEPIPGPQ